MCKKEQHNELFSKEWFRENLMDNKEKLISLLNKNRNGIKGIYALSIGKYLDDPLKHEELADTVISQYNDNPKIGDKCFGIEVGNFIKQNFSKINELEINKPNSIYSQIQKEATKIINCGKDMSWLKEQPSYPNDLFLFLTTGNITISSLRNVDFIKSTNLSDKTLKKLLKGLIEYRVKWEEKMKLNELEINKPGRKGNIPLEYYTPEVSNLISKALPIMNKYRYYYLSFVNKLGWTSAYRKGRYEEFDGEKELVLSNQIIQYSLIDRELQQILYDIGRILEDLSYDTELIECFILDKYGNIWVGDKYNQIVYKKKPINELEINKPKRIHNLDKPGVKFKNINVGDELQFSVRIIGNPKKLEVLKQRVIGFKDEGLHMITQDLDDFGELKSSKDFWGPYSIENYYKKELDKLNESQDLDWTSINKAIKGFKLEPTKNGFSNAFTTLNGKATSQLAKQINTFLHTKLGYKAVKFVYEPTYQTLNLSLNKLDELEINKPQSYDIEYLEYDGDLEIPPGKYKIEVEETDSEDKYLFDIINKNGITIATGIYTGYILSKGYWKNNKKFIKVLNKNLEKYYVPTRYLNELEINKPKKLFKINDESGSMKELGKEYNNEFIEILKEFVKYCCNELKIPLPKIKLVNHKKYTEKNKSYGGYIPSENQIIVTIYEKMLAEVMRTISHEIMHSYQQYKGLLKANSGDDGSNEENDANSYSGKTMRYWGRKYPQIFFMKYLS